MSRIKAFNAIVPNKGLAAEVVTRPLECYSLGEARLIASENIYSFLHLINPELDNQYLRGSRQELIYKKISDNIESFLDAKYIEKINQPSIFIYRVNNKGRLQTGYWTLTSVLDNMENTILKHELTVARREKLLADYLQQTCLDANPVLITHEVNPVLKRFIEKYTALSPIIQFEYNDGSFHELWQISDEQELEEVELAFRSLEKVYLADGHHRIASMTNMALAKSKLDPNEDFNAPYNYFTSVYMDFEEVKIYQFHRLVKDILNFNTKSFLAAIEYKFDIVPLTNDYVPASSREIGMYLDNKWYKLIPHSDLFKGDVVKDLDVSILHDHILFPILDIEDPRTDARIQYEGGLAPISELKRLVDSENFKVLFTLRPTSLEELKAVADAGASMPPKSTWVEPKFLVGLVINYFA